MRVMDPLAHGCYATALGQLDSNPRPRGRWPSTLTTGLPRHPIEDVNVHGVNCGQWTVGVKFRPKGAITTTIKQHLRLCQQYGNRTVYTAL